MIMMMKNSRERWTQRWRRLKDNSDTADPLQRHGQYYAKCTELAKNRNRTWDFMMRVKSIGICSVTRNLVATSVFTDFLKQTYSRINFIAT